MTKDVRLAMHALIDAVIAARADRAIVRPVLLAMVQTALSDFERYFDARHASARIRDFDILMARQRAAKEQTRYERDDLIAKGR